MKEIEKIAILGGGLLGGSLAMAMQDRLETCLWARRAEAVESARELGIKCASTDLKSTIAAADLVILTVPVGAMESLIEKALECGLNSSSLVSDVGSVKRAVHRNPGSLLKRKGIPFIGSHPMAGSEQRGVEASRKDLFAGAMCFLTDDDQVGEPWTGRLEAFWNGLDCRICWTDSASHDELVARISHFPHVIAAAAALVSLGDPSDARFGGGGLRDTTRVAGGDPEMWAEILMENRHAVSHSVEQAMSVLGEIQSSLKQGDHESIKLWLEKAKSLHQKSRSQELS
ncbi:prephenate dehydrogenase [Haloferula chungangensis]|uniref:Prephenate dehydrogenase n=1 Tax=Haloferula chungangensis TaxID=1048331 RepID=A0ABW2L3M2_9BACT